MSNTIRFTGLSSGLDTQSIVDAMLLTYKNKVNTAKQNKTLLEWKKDAYKEMNTKINSFYDKYVDNLSLTNSLNKIKTNVSNTNIISIPSNQNVPSGNYEIEVKQMASRAVVNTAQLDIGDTVTNLKELKLLSVAKEAIAGKFTMKVDQEEISVDVNENTTIGEFEDAVKAELIKQGITTEDFNFEFNEKLKAFNINTKTTGAKNRIEIDDASLKLINGISVSQGQDAKITYNNVTITSPTNRISISDFEFDIIGAAEGEKITISSVADTEAVINYVKDFVEAYNTLLEDINTKVGADKNKNYKPLTDEEKEEMSEKEIELWENKIKDSLFSGDASLRDLSSTLQSTLQGTISNEGKYKILYDIGISTGNWREQGKLHLDTDKLTKVLSSESDDVVNLIKGLGNSLKENLKSTLKSRNDLKSYNSIFNDKLILTEITQKSDEIINAQSRYDRMETYYYAKFTAMESMMNQYNSQSTWLSQL